MTIGTVVHQFCHVLVVDPSIGGWDDLEGTDVAVHELPTPSTVLTEAIVAEKLGSVDAITAFLSGAFQTEADDYGEMFAFPWDSDHLANIPANR